ncbi:MAG: F0F1 ATP synthase subunit B [Clostridiales bacterium]|nr:F0F1 ATP synthase subunit B [Clostridiales bacterium]
MAIHLIDVVEHILNIILLYVILRSLLYRPVRSFMQSRQERLQGEREEARAQLDSALQMKNTYEACLQNAEAEAQDTLRLGLQNADKSAREILEKARQEAREILLQGREQLAQEQRESIGALQDSIVELAVGLASKIMQREVSAEDNQRVIDRYFSEVS